MKFTGKLPPSLYSVQDIAKGCLDFDHQGTKIVWWSSDVSSSLLALVILLPIQGGKMVNTGENYQLL